MGRVIVMNIHFGQYHRDQLRESWKKKARIVLSKKFPMNIFLPEIFYVALRMKSFIFKIVNKK